MTTLKELEELWGRLQVVKEKIRDERKKIDKNSEMLKSLETQYETMFVEYQTKYEMLFRLNME